MHPDGEVGIARAVHALGSIYVQSAVSSYSIEELARAAPGPLWFQLYPWKDRGFVEELLQRARAAGHSALVLTVDVPRASGREREKRHGFGVPPRLTAGNVRDALLRPGWSARFLRDPRVEMGNVASRSAPASEEATTMIEYVNRQFDPAVTWDTVEWLRERWDGPLVLKGLLRGEDAETAVRSGVDAIVVSNHGGRQLDGARSSISALPEIVDVVDGRAEVYLDSGVRRGSDVAKALALGARACLVGRAAVYGLGAGGEAGARRAMGILLDELATALALMGCPAVGDVDRSWLVGA